MSDVKRCAACRQEKPVSEMKVCMHNQMHRYVCDMKCMNAFYNPPKKAAPEAEPVAWLYRNTEIGDQLMLNRLDHYFRRPYSADEHDYIKGVPLYAAPQHDAGWREHSKQYAKGEKCPETIETLQAAWDRDQELMMDQKAEISRLKEKLNRAEQRNKPHDAELVELLAAMRSFTLEHDSGIAGVLRGKIDAKLAALSAKP